MPTPDEIADLIAMARNPAFAAERAARAAAFDPARRWIDGSRKRLSDRLWDARVWSRDQIDQVLRHAIATGEDANLTAKKLEQFLDPRYAPIRTDKGRMVRGQNRAIVTSAPGRGGSGSWPARTLARTEISRAHAAGTLVAAERSPFVVGVRWQLSGRHPRADGCNDQATRDVGFGPGIYPPSEAPTMPFHANCLCVYVPVPVSDSSAVVDALRSVFGLGPR